MAAIGETVSDSAAADAIEAAIASGDVTTVNRTETFLGYTIDHHSECVALTLGLDDSARGLLSTALASPTFGNCETTTARIEAWGATGRLVPDYDYFR